MLSTQLLHPQVLDCVLSHPSIGQHQQTICLLLSTSKDVRKAVAARLRGQLPVQLAVAGRQKQKVLQLAAWLSTHASLVQGLTLRLSDFERRRYAQWHDPRYDLWATELESIAASLQQAAGTGQLFLQHFCLQGTPVTLGVLAALPASWLTSLDCEVRGRQFPAHKTRSWSNTLAYISQLSQLRQLDISKEGPLYVAEEALQGLTCLQQLTKLQLGKAGMKQLQQLPPNLQQLDCYVQLHASADVDRLASWMKQHARAVTRLQIEGDVLSPISAENSEGVLVAALRHAAAEAASGQLPLRHFIMSGVSFSSAMYTALSSCCRLDSLCCRLFAGGLFTSQLATICSFASLSELTLASYKRYAGMPEDVRQMSGLTNLTKLRVVGMTAAHLCYLPVQLKELEAFGGEWNDHSLALGHLTCMTRLSICSLHSEDDVLPPSIVSLKVGMDHTTLQPLLVLHTLQELHLSDQKHFGLISGQELLTLSKLSTLKNITISYVCDEDKTLDASHCNALTALSLKRLCVECEDMVFDCVISMLSNLQGLTALEVSGDFPETPSIGLALQPLAHLQELIVDGSWKLVHSAINSAHSLVRAELSEDLDAAVSNMLGLRECKISVK